MTYQELLEKTAADLAHLRTQLIAARDGNRNGHTAYTNLHLSHIVHDLANIETSLTMAAALTPEMVAEMPSWVGPQPAGPVVTYERINHAAHYLYNDPRKGHDLEKWTYSQEQMLPKPAEIPAEATFLSGSREGNRQSWTWVRPVPWAEPTCPRCAVVATPEVARG